MSSSQPDSRATSTRMQTTRRRRRAAARFANNNSRAGSSERSEVASNTSSKTDDLGVTEMNEANHRLIQDILDVRLEQNKADFVRFPLTTTSMLNLTGWRVLRCANNLDLLVSRHTLISFHILQLSNKNVMTLWFFHLAMKILC